MEEISIEDGDSLGDEDYFPTTSEASGSDDGAQQGSVYQDSTRSAIPEPSVTQGRLARLTTDCDAREVEHPKDVPEDGLGSAPHGKSPLHPGPSESSSAAPTVSKVAAGKRPASDAIDESRLPKKFHSVSATTAAHTSITADTSTTARTPSTLTAYKQEHTILYVMLPGPTSVMVPIKLRSAMTMSALFSSVSAAAGVLDYENMAIVVKLGGENGSIMVKQEIMETFEVFLEIINEARCWGEETGSLSLGVQLRWRYLCKMDAQM